MGFVVCVAQSYLLVKTNEEKIYSSRWYSRSKSPFKMSRINIKLPDTWKNRKMWPILKRKDSQQRHPLDDSDVGVSKQRC